MQVLGHTSGGKLKMCQGEGLAHSEDGNQADNPPTDPWAFSRGEVVGEVNTCGQPQRFFKG